MRTYRQYCPVARAAEVVGERWNLLIVRNLLFGAETFTAIAAGVPTMSRSMLVRRLGELERAGVIVRTPKPNGQGSLYTLTPAGSDLHEVVEELGRWGERWVEFLPEHTDPGFALWAWCQVELSTAELPDHRIVVAFEFPDQRPGNRFFWLLIEHGAAELCATDPGGEPDARVRASSAAFVDWRRGELDWQAATRTGRIELTGKPTVVEALPTWSRHAHAPL